MVASQITKDLLLDLYCLYRDRSLDYTIEELAIRAGRSRSRLGELFKRINPSNLGKLVALAHHYNLKPSQSDKQFFAWLKSKNA